jgi:phage terminase large subunit
MPQEAESANEYPMWEWYSPTPKQEILHTSPAKNLLAIGGGGSGKSMFLLGEAIYTCLQYPGANCLLLRRDFPELEKGLILDFKATVPADDYKYNDQKHIAAFANGSKIFFGHLQNQSEKSLSQYLSAAFVFIGIDELGQFSYEAYSFLSWRNRINKDCQPDMNGDMPIPRMGGATNPLGPGYGWIKTVWVDKKPVSQLGQTVKKHDGKFYQNVHGRDEIVFDPEDYVFVHSTVLDNPHQLAKDPDYINKLMRLPPAMRQKALYGDLNAVAGQYFSNFTYDRHILSLPRDHDKIKWEPWQPRWMSIDWGLAHHSAIYWFTRAQVLDIESKWRNRVICYRELVINETGHRELIRRIAAQMGDDEKKTTRHIFLSPERFNRTGDTQHTLGDEMADLLHELGLPRCVAANNRRVDGAVFCYNLLETGDVLLLEEECPHLIRTLQTVVRSEKDLEDVLKADSIEDDCYDSWRYGLMSMLSEKGKPQTLKDQERIAAIQDPAQRLIASYQLHLKNQQRNQPRKIKIAPRWMGR